MNPSASRDEFHVVKKKFQFFRLMAYFKPFLGLLLVCVLMALIINASALAKPYILKHIIDDYISVGNYSMGRIRFLGVVFFLLIITGSVFGYLQNYLLTYIGQKIMYRIRNQLFSHVQKMSMKFFDQYSSGRILTRVTNDVEALNELYSGVMINLFRDAIMIIGIIVTMLAMDAELALICIGSVPLIAVVTLVYRFTARKNFIRMKGMIARINAFLAENISGMKLVQIFHREKEKFNEFKKLDDEFYKTSRREIVLNSIGRPIIDVINHVVIAVLLWYCTGKIFDRTLEIGVLYAFITYIKQVFEPISEIAEKYTTIQSAVISSERIFEILDLKEFQESFEGGKPVLEFHGNIEFKHVWFAYHGENWVLRDVSFKINPGEMVAFVGATGSGKSTIINLMARFYEIQKGEILVDGVNIRDFNLKDLRRRIAVVMQDVFLFCGDILSNIRLNNESITEEDAKNAAVSIGADSFIHSLPGKYHEMVMERGCTFSAGQRQLISFVRAVAYKPSILVLDEATANIDTETETVIQRAMTHLCEGRTAIVIAHRLSTIRDADRIIVIHKGQIAETGTHDELMDKRGRYWKLYSAQVK